MDLAKEVNSVVNNKALSESLPRKSQTPWTTAQPTQFSVVDSSVDNLTLRIG